MTFVQEKALAMQWHERIKSRLKLRGAFARVSRAGRIVRCLSVANGICSRTSRFAPIPERDALLAYFVR